MIISALHNESLTEVYIDLHAEQSFTGSFLIFNEDIDNNFIEGIYPTLLKEDTVENIVKYFKKAPKNKMIVLDFKNIDDVQINKIDLFASLNEKTDLLVFQNVNENIIKQLNLKIFNSISNIVENNKYRKFFLSMDNCDKIELKETDNLFYDVFLNRLTECKDSKPENRKHHSSSVYLPVFLDLKKMMVNDKSFFVYVIYKLAMKMRDKWELIDKKNDDKKDLVLFCQNLNSAFMASLLASFLKLDILSMDHIGPINKVYSNLKNRIQEGSNYIVISDLVCLGTEVKICKNIINYSGGNYFGNASIVRIETLKPEDDYTDYEYIFKITKENNALIGYRIETALMQ